MTKKILKYDTASILFWHNNVKFPRSWKWGTAGKDSWIYSINNIYRMESD